MARKLLKELPSVVAVSKKKVGGIVIGMSLILSTLIFSIASYKAESRKALSSDELASHKVTVSEEISAEGAIEQLALQNNKKASLSKAKPQKGKVYLPITNTHEMEQGEPTQKMGNPNQIEGNAERVEAQKEGYRSPISSTSYYGIDNLKGESQRVNRATLEPQSDRMLQKALSNLNQMPNQYGIQNGQSQKAAFLKKMSKADNDFTLLSKLNKPISPYTISAGKAIDATFRTGINSDLPGKIIAVVSRNIYDSANGNHLLIPQGTEILGEYSSQISYGQDRVLLAWTRLSFPNGDSFDLQGMPGVNLAGLAGISDQVDNHTLKIFGSTLAFSVFGALGQLSQPRQAANAQPSNAQIIYGAIGQEMTQAAAKMVEKNLNIQPTIKIRPGTRFKVLITKDMIFPGTYQFN